ncbi:MAG: HAD family hydrolase [Janthinobacterium lividum]
MSHIAQRAWNAYDAYLFDIDGTLLHCRDAVHYFAFCETLGMLAGRSLNLDGVMAHGNTDVGILRDALSLAGIPEIAWRPQLAAARQRLCDEVDRHKQDLQIDVLPQVPEVLQHLRANGALLGVATGNLRDIGRTKLQHCDLLKHFDFGGYSDDFEFRKHVFAAALVQARTLVGEQAAVCVVGDTPSDVQAAHANGLPVIAIATGVFSKNELQKSEPEWCLDTFLDLLPLS